MTLTTPSSVRTLSRGTPRDAYETSKFRKFRRCVKPAPPCPPFAAAEQHLQKAVQLEPENLAYIIALAQLQLAKKDTEAARRTLEPLLRFPNVEAQLRTRAEEMLQEISSPSAR